MKLVRNKVFETNSSSCHSISIAESDGIYESLPVSDVGIVNINSGEFGWEQEGYNSSDTKASYIAVYIRDWCKGKEDEFRQIFESLIKEHTGCEEVIYEDNFWDKEERSYRDRDGKLVTYMSKIGEGYIDHQSVEDNDYHYLFENPSLLKEFIFNPKSTLTTDNDNRSDYYDD